MLWIALSVASAQDACSRTSVGKLAAIPDPGLLVLGERKGTQPDLARARKIVTKLAKSRPVTLALQAVAADQQAVLDRYEAGEIPITSLAVELDWQNSWGFPFEEYVPLLEAARAVNAQLVAIGGPYETRPADAVLPLPPGYALVLADAMGDSPVSVELEGRYVDRVAWADHRFAAAALAGWDTHGALILVVDRFHVEGGLGAAWQAQRLTEATVWAALLANADSPCYPGDLTLP